ncbi:MAG TPA: DUF5916 domain-containing protein [Gemmatimonadales bacterium]|nr:DUF5916 domain-containing protein [Gemmatimonadales bacterium]
MVNDTGPRTATPITEPVRLDGHLDEPFWASADSIWDFRQQEPAEGMAATERTVIKLARDQEALYVGVRAYDSDVRGLRATQLRRDADLEVDDYVLLLIDSFHDHRSGFFFGTNPNGAMWDAQFTGVDDANLNWDGIWDVVATRDSSGWTAEFRIPFRTLRYQAGGDGKFGFNVRRLIRRKNEMVLWRGWGREEGLFRLIYEGEVGGFEDLRRGTDLEVRPYVLGRATATEHDAQGNVLADGGATAKLGVDAKLALTPTMTADLTVNTDFAQVEVDEQVINLTRFPTFFPEKREFFLESSGIFDFATPGKIQPFYSRRIGLTDSGQVVPMLVGGRVYGKLGPWTLGALDVQTGNGDDANNLVVRLKHDLFDRSYIGAIGVQRIAHGGLGAERVGGLDIDLPLVVERKNIEPSFWIMGSQTPGIAGFPTAWRFGTDFPNDLIDAFISLYRVDAGFNPTLGFTSRTGIWETTSHIDIMPRPHVLGIRQFDFLFPIPSWDIIANESGSLFHTDDWQTATFEWRPLGADFESGARFEANVQRLFDAPVDSFEVFRGVTIAPGRYWWTRGELQFASSPSHPFSLSTLFSYGDFYDGTDTELSLGADWRSGGHLILGSTVSQSRVALPEGAFNATQVAGRLEYAFNTRISFLGFGQYNNEDQRVDFNLRFHWIPRIGDDFFVVWNSGYTTDPAAPHRFPSTHALGAPLNGALIVKAVHRIAF